MTDTTQQVADIIRDVFHQAPGDDIARRNIWILAAEALAAAGLLVDPEETT